MEFAFEGHRYWDIRRWKIGAQICNGSVLIDATDPSKGGYMSCCYPLRQSDGTVKYLTPSTEKDLIKTGEKLYKPVRTVNNSYKWNDKNYLMPIPQEAIDKNPALKGAQNPGY